ncbi:MAG TPA: thioredoxin [Flavisolibacter sp.]
MKPFLLILTLLVAWNAQAQLDTTTAAYLRYPSLPPIYLLLADSTTMYTKEKIPTNRPVLVMLFSPECSHCQQETESLIAHKGQFRDIQVIMTTTQPLWQMNDFIKRNRLHELDFVVVGRDLYYMLPPFYMIRNLPFLGLYNHKGKLIRGLEGSHGMPAVLKLFKSAGSDRRAESQHR